MGYWDLNTPSVRLPDRRILRAFAFDPMSSRLTGRYLSVGIRFEPGLEEGPGGQLVQVVDYDAFRKTWYRPVDLDDPALLAQNGLQPSESDPRSHQQVVYAVAMSVIERFERFLGRRFRWRGSKAKLRLVPHAFEGRNAYFDPDRNAVLFGYYRADRQNSEAGLPGQMMFTCLSVDVVAHEVTHAIVHRLRRHFSMATNPDVFAWHEASADLVALFHHFLFPEVVASAVSASRGNLGSAEALFDLAAEFGRSTGRGRALRSAIADQDPRADKFTGTHEPHIRGGIFVAAVFDAFLATYRARIADLQRLATGGTGILPDGSIPPDLVNRVTREAVHNADRILGMVVRAFDFLPVVDPDFGDVVRAIITADRILFPDDELHLRATLVECLRRRGIYPPGVSSLADDALVWPQPQVRLSLSEGSHPVDLTRFIVRATLKLDPDGAVGAVEGDGSAATHRGSGLHDERMWGNLTRWSAEHALDLGLDPDLPVTAIGAHVSYLMAADGQTHPQIVAQLLQRHEELEGGEIAVPMYAGTTVVARADGTVQYIVTKPLPLTNPAKVSDLEEPRKSFVRDCHARGIVRLEKLRAWIADVESADDLSLWSGEPALTKLSFAHLHAEGDA